MYTQETNTAAERLPIKRAVGVAGCNQHHAYGMDVNERLYVYERQPIGHITACLLMNVNKRTDTSHMSTRARFLEESGSQPDTDSALPLRAKYTSAYEEHCKVLHVCQQKHSGTAVQCRRRRTHVCVTGCAHHQAAAAVRKHSLLQQSQRPGPPLQERRGAAVPPVDLIVYHKVSSSQYQELELAVAAAAGELRAASPHSGEFPPHNHTGGRGAERAPPPSTLN